MSGIFSSPFGTNSVLKEGIVTNVDPIRFICTVRTSSGQTLPNVTWLLPTGGSGVDGVHVAPNVFDKVLLCMSTSSPIIVGCIPRMGIPDTNVPTVSGTILGVDQGNSSELKNGFSLNPNKPSDFIPGDKVMTSKGGGMIALLSSGGVMLRSSYLAHIFMSKFNGLVRIVSRNFYRFSDASSQVAASVKGTLYTWFGADWDLNRTTTNTERYNEATGHIPAAKLMRGEPSPNVVIPAKGTRVREYWLTDTQGNEVMVETLHEDGKLTIHVINPVGGNTLVTQDDSLWSSRVENGTISTVTILPGSINLNYNDVSTANLDDAGIQLNAKGHFAIIDDTGVHLG